MNMILRESLDLSPWFYVGFAIIVGIATAVYNNRAVYGVLERDTMLDNWLFWPIVTPIIAGVTAKFVFHPTVFTVIIAVFIFLLIINNDGRQRADAWFSQLILWTVMLAVSVAQTFTTGPNLWVITYFAPVIALVAGEARVKYLGADDFDEGAARRRNIMNTALKIIIIAALLAVIIIAIVSAVKGGE